MNAQAEFEQMLAQMDSELEWREYESENESEGEFPSQCKPQLVLNKFEVGDYRLRPHHYDPLLTFLRKVRDNPFPPNAGLFLQGFTDGSGGEVMNSGLGLSRALEVQHFIQGLLQKESFKKLLVLPITIGSSGKFIQISSNPALNRRVEIGVCTLPAPAKSSIRRKAIPTARRQLPIRRT